MLKLLREGAVPVRIMSSSAAGGKTREGLAEFMKSMKVLPKLIVFDVDYTLWPFHVDMSVYPPFRADGKGGAVDSCGYKINLYKDVRLMLSQLKEQGIILAAASKTTDPSASRELLGVLGVDKMFDQLEIFPARKFNHFRNIKKASGVEYKDMLFFDDEYPNIRDISTLSVTCFYIDDEEGITLPRLKEGLEQFSDKNSP